MLQRVFARAELRAGMVKPHRGAWILRTVWRDSDACDYRLGWTLQHGMPCGKLKATQRGLLNVARVRKQIRADYTG
jgi:hypothetical protein